MREALYYAPEEQERVRCHLCPHECLIPEGKPGVCHVRVNRGGKLYTEVYGRLSAIHSDPIEKKPLYHFYPGRTILSVGTRGCNLRCSFCQNYNLSQSDGSVPSHEATFLPGELVKQALSVPGNIGIAYTYNEPAIFYEFMADTALEAHSAGLKNVMVTNGYINPEPLRELLPLMDAFNVDLKSFTDTFYRKMTGGSLAPVLATLKSIVNAGRHLEITMLVIPTLNDSVQEFRDMVEWISMELGPDVPLHLSRYFPAWKLSVLPTPESTLEEFAGLASEKLRYVYTGNVTTDLHASTCCPHCHSKVIRRKGYQVSLTGLTGEGTCLYCGAPVAGTF